MYGNVFPCMDVGFVAHLSGLVVGQASVTKALPYNF